MKIRLSSLFVAIAFASVVMASSIWIKQAVFGSSGSGVSAASANRHIWASLTLPDMASDVNYHADSYGCEAEFAISEPVFSDWCANRGWRVTPIETPNVYYRLNQNRPIAGKGRIVAGGYHFYPPDGEGTFDVGQSRAEFCVSTFP